MKISYENWKQLERILLKLGFFIINNLFLVFDFFVEYIFFFSSKLQFVWFKRRESIDTTNIYVHILLLLHTCFILFNIRIYLYMLSSLIFFFLIEKENNTTSTFGKERKSANTNAAKYRTIFAKMWTLFVIRIILCVLVKQPQKKLCCSFI